MNPENQEDVEMVPGAALAPHPGPGIPLRVPKDSHRSGNVRTPHPDRKPSPNSTSGSDLHGGAMSNDKTKGSTNAVPHMPAVKPPQESSAPTVGTPPPQPPAKIEVIPALLSYSLARDLERTPREEWFRIESIPWRVPFTRDMVDGIRFVDTVANVINQQGGLFVTQGLDRRRDLEQYSQQIVDAFRALVGITVQVARKTHLTNILQKHWRLLSIYGSPPKKAEVAKTQPKPDAPKQDTGPAEAA